MAGTFEPDGQAKRVLELDASRALAMLAVYFSHSTDLLVGRWDSNTGRLLLTSGMVATPAFLLLSGAICGLLTYISHKSPSELRWRLIDRGLFMLLVVHLILGLTHATWLSWRVALFNSFYMTDALGIALIVAGLGAQQARRRNLLIAAAVLLVGSWCVGSLNAPQTDAGRYLTRMLFGLREITVDDDGWIVPVIPYLGLFLIGIAAGKTYASLLLRRTTKRQTAVICLAIGFACVALALVLKLSWLGLKPKLPMRWQPIIYALTEPRLKLPPSIAYCFAYGGIALCIFALVNFAVSVSRYRPIIDKLAVAGRASLLVYIAQYYVTYVPEQALHLHNTPALWPLAVLPSLLLLWSLAWLWDRIGGNRLYTVGLKEFGTPAAELLPLPQGPPLPNALPIRLKPG